MATTHARSFQFSGTGAPVMLRIAIAGGTPTANGRGAMVDDIRLTETLPNGNGVFYGLAGSAIALPRIDAQLTDLEGSEVLTVELLNLPIGAVISEGSRSITVDGSSATLTITGRNLANSGPRPPAGFVGTLQLQVRATATELSNRATASVTQNLTVVVLSGTSAATPVGANPYVNLAPALASGSPSAPSVTVVLIGLPQVDASGAVQLAAPPANGVSRTREEEVAADALRAQQLQDPWLRQLEAAAQAHWSALVAGG